MSPGCIDRQTDNKKNDPYMQSPILAGYKKKVKYETLHPVIQNHSFKFHPFVQLGCENRSLCTDTNCRISQHKFFLTSMTQLRKKSFSFISRWGISVHTVMDEGWEWG